MKAQLYALCDIDMIASNGSTIDEFVSLSNSNKAKLLQYRDKSSSLLQKKENLQFIKSNFNGKVIVNDDISLVQFCDGLHVGQDDLSRYKKDKKESIAYIRDIISNKILGLSTHNIDEVKESNGLDIDYIGLGAYRATKTKNICNLLGEQLSSIASFSNRPVGAIGGVLIDDAIDNVAYNVVGSGMYKL